MKTRILHIVLSMETGGLENGIVNIINYSNNDKFEMDILCLRAGGELISRITNPSSHVYFDDNDSHSLFNAIKKVYLHCQQYDYDIIHSHGYTTMLAAYVGGTLAKSPCIINGEHGTLYFSSLKKRLLQKFLFKKMRINLTVSESLKEQICQVFSTSSKYFKTIINGVDIDKFTPTAINNDLASELKISPNTVVVGAVGRLVKVKNYDSLLRAMKLVLQNNTKALLIIAGDGPEREKLENLTRQLNIENDVIFLGRKDNIHELMNMFNIFVLPSYYEGLSNTLLEAMACGVPVVASDVGGNKELVNTGSTGYLYPSNDSELLADNLLSLIGDIRKRRQFGKNARHDIEKNYSIQRMVNNYEETYQGLHLNNGLR